MSSATYDVDYANGVHSLSEIVEGLVAKYPKASEILIICMFCRTLPKGVPKETFDEFDKVTRMLSDGSECGRTPTAEKNAILKGLSAANRFSL